MKKFVGRIVMLAVLLLSVSSITFGQFEVGLKGGLNSSTQSEIGNIWNNDKTLYSYNFGFHCRYIMKNNFSVKSGIDYSRIGKKYDESFSSNNITESYDYLHVPLKIAYSIPVTPAKLNSSSIYLATGPYAAFLLNADQDGANSAADLKNEAKSFDYGLALEIGYEIPLSGHALQISFNYNMGLSKVTSLDNDLMNKAASLNFSFYF